MLQQSSRRSILIAIGASAVAWLPVVVLSALQGSEVLRGFLLDYAAQSRLLLVIAVLIIAEPALIKRLELIANRFLEEKLITEEDRLRFEYALARFQRWGNSGLAQTSLFAFACLIAVLTLPYIEPDSFLPWCHGSGGIKSLSPAGSWYVLVSLPITMYFLLRWLWQQLLWGVFLGAVARMNLRIVPAHPDKVAGLGFLRTSDRKYIPFSFAIGTIIAGGVANRVLHEHYALPNYQLIPVLTIALVIAICAAPVCVFFTTLVDAKRRGIFEYGALASAVGRRFEEKWLTNKEGNALEAKDFSATIDLYSVVANVEQMHPFPLKISSLSRLAIWSVIPFLPVLLASLGYETVLKRLLKMLM